MKMDKRKTKKKIHKCELCEKVFSQKGYLIGHQQVVHENLRILQRYRAISAMRISHHHCDKCLET